MFDKLRRAGSGTGADELRKAVDAVRAGASELTGADADYDQLMHLIGDARVVLLGEASHGTDEFYRERARITKRLIAEKGFTAVAVEADWPDALRVARYVRGGTTDRDGREALGGFSRFPIWMWRNESVLELVEWMRDWNCRQGSESALRDRNPRTNPSRSPSPNRKNSDDCGATIAPSQIGFYGLDLYSMHSSMNAVLEFLDRVDPEAGQRARARYGCFDHFGPEPQAYGYMAGMGLAENCEREALDMLLELRTRRAELTRAQDGAPAEAEAGADAQDEQFYAEQNARLVRNAEQYYRSMFRGRVSSWNLRDGHMAETLGALLTYLDERLKGEGEEDRRGRAEERPFREAKVVVWAHNSHLGDARATEMGEAGELNLGQLARQMFGEKCVNVGFTTHTGWVTAADDWGGAAHRKRVRPSLAGSYEDAMHRTAEAARWGKFYLPLRTSTHQGTLSSDELRSALAGPKLERAIGVIYLPESERQSHYFHARLPEQFDAVIHVERSNAVVPLDRSPESEAAFAAHHDHLGGDEGDAPETYPWGV